MKIYIERIKNLRESNDLTRNDVSEYLGVSTQIYCEYENGQRKMTIGHLEALCLLYNVSADYILGFTDEKSSII